MRLSFDMHKVNKTIKSIYSYHSSLCIIAGRAGLQSFERMTIQLGWEILSSDIYDPVDTDSKTTIPSILMNIKSKGQMFSY